MSIITSALKQVTEGKYLSKTKATELFDHIFTHDMSENDVLKVAGILCAIQARTVTDDELSGFATSMINNAVKIDYPHLTLDTCGTGGDSSFSINISTAAALTLASMGIKVAKHGNRSASSKCGSADILERLGVSIDNKPETAITHLDNANFTFLFARTYHPAMGKVGPIRTALGVRTVFNLLGPITNPANPKAQVMGVYDNKYAPILAHTLQGRGSRGYIVHSESGLDEVTTLSGDRSFITAFDADRTSEYIVSPSDFGIAGRQLSDIQAGESVEENYNAIVKLLNGIGEAAHVEAVALNAAFGKSAYEDKVAHGGDLSELKANYELIYSHINSGKVAEFMYDKFGVIFK